MYGGDILGQEAILRAQIKWLGGYRNSTVRQDGALDWKWGTVKTVRNVRMWYAF